MISLWHKTLNTKQNIAFLLYWLIFLSYNHLNAQLVTVSGAIVGNGTYATLGAAFTAINSGSHPGANIWITITGNTNEGATVETFPHPGKFSFNFIAFK